MTVDYFSDFLELDHLRSISSVYVIKKLKGHFMRHGIPEQLVTNLQSTNCGNYTGTSVTFPQSCCPLQSEFTLVLTVPNCLDNSLNNLNHRTLLQYKFVHCVLCYDIQDQYYVMQSQLRLIRRSKTRDALHLES